MQRRSALLPNTVEERFGPSHSMPGMRETRHRCLHKTHEGEREVPLFYLRSEPYWSSEILLPKLQGVLAIRQEQGQ